MSIASLRADAANTKAQNQRLRQQLHSLEHRLSEALGREVATELGPGDTDQPEELRAQLEDSHAHAFELGEEPADAREELEAVREINRELLSDRNRPAR